ncbi:helix-turn-helix domain-containing protein [Domibacillus enclensis]|uniref:DNA-binding transcriptional regulator, XRE-family HTH domain n=1 Tax=Domibacillus enclensis TaxID=1017273 RepID=A0A1N6WEC0_9BACI|nr:helix-turn-helix transcriptional regulator [Domibacillus enclensis]SIQ88477.1 DNA-binding transcriptional regulator, XRE-family HTH domain [Domibacillus enclensis]
MLGERLKSLRKERKLTQEELGKRVNVTKVSISGYENGKRSPDTETLQKLADFFDVSTDYLLGRSEHKTTVEIEKSEPTDSLSIINKMVEDFGFEDFGFFDIEEWKNLSSEDIDEIRRHFEWIAQKAKERNNDDSFS